MGWIIFDAVMIAYNAWLLEREIKDRNSGWKYVWVAFLIFWIVNLLIDTVGLFLGVKL